PGGSAAWLTSDEGPVSVARWRCSDGVLAAASFYSDDIEAAVEQLEEIGIIYVDDSDSAVEMNIVDQFDGPAMPCTWLEWKREDDVTSCWLTDSDHIEFVAPKE